MQLSHQESTLLGILREGHIMQMFSHIVLLLTCKFSGFTRIKLLGLAMTTDASIS